MGIINVTPDSFADGGPALRSRDAPSPTACRWSRTARIILDVGGESTRPGAAPLPADEELRRVLPVVERLAQEAGVPISIDTYKAVVAREAVERGATIVNDVSGASVRRSAGGRRRGDGRGARPDAQSRAIAGHVPGCEL